MSVRKLEPTIILLLNVAITVLTAGFFPPRCDSSASLLLAWLGTEFFGFPPQKHPLVVFTPVIKLAIAYTPPPPQTHLMSCSDDAYLPSANIVGALCTSLSPFDAAPKRCWHDFANLANCGSTNPSIVKIFLYSHSPRYDVALTRPW